MTNTNELADSESNKANRLADLEPAAYRLTTKEGVRWAQTFPGDPHPEDANNIEEEEPLFAASDIIQLLDDRIMEYCSGEAETDRAVVNELRNLQDVVLRSKNDNE